MLQTFLINNQHNMNTPGHVQILNCTKMEFSSERVSHCELDIVISDISNYVINIAEIKAVLCCI